VEHTNIIYAIYHSNLIVILCYGIKYTADYSRPLTTNWLIFTQSDSSMLRLHFLGLLLIQYIMGLRFAVYID
jgi:hypothetical protein